MRVFQYLAFFTPNEAEVEAGEKPRLIVQPTFVVSESQQAVALLAARAIPDEYVDKLDRVEVAVRPF